MAIPIFVYGKIKPLRQAKGLNQAEIAAELGISRPTYVLMEQGGKEPTLTQLHTLARLLGVETSELCANLPPVGAAIADYAKFKDLLAACIELGASEGKITKTKLSLLTYLTDFACHFHNSKPMTGETYRYTPRGPVADDFFRALDELYEAQAITLHTEGTSLVVRILERRPTKLLNKDEVTLISQVCEKWKAESTEAVSVFVLERLEPKSTKLGDPIAYESILAETAQSLY